MQMKNVCRITDVLHSFHFDTRVRAFKEAK